MTSQEERQAIIDEEHLKILSIAHAVEGSMYAFASLFGLLYLVLGGAMVAMLSQVPKEQGQPPVEIIGGIFALFGGGVFGLLMLVTVLKFLCARNLWTRRSRTLCFVVSVFSCIAFPYGTAIGVWTIVVLLRPSVERLFAGASKPGGGPGQLGAGEV